MKHLSLAVLLVLLFSGCTMSFQPFPSVSQKDFQEFTKYVQQNQQALAEAIVKLQPKEQKK